MNIDIVSYNNEYFETISQWWKDSCGTEPVEGMMIENGTFILMINKVPALCVTVLLTQSKQMAYIFGFVKNPLFKGINLEPYGKVLWDYCADFAKAHGYKRLLCFADNPKLKEKYERFGFTKTLDNLSSFVREI
jgi:hypothetical protein